MTEEKRIELKKMIDSIDRDLITQATNFIVVKGCKCLEDETYKKMAKLVKRKINLYKAYLGEKGGNV